MKTTLTVFAFMSAVFFVSGCEVSHAQDTIFSGTVNRVWGDGFQLNSGDRSITVNSYDICGDNNKIHNVYVFSRTI